MAPSKTNKMKKLRPLWKTNFSRYTSLPFGPKRFHHLKGPKNAPCLWLSQWQEIQIFNMVCLKIFRLKKLGVTSGFYLLKFYFVFDFGHFSPVCTSLTPPVTDMLWKSISQKNLKKIFQNFGKMQNFYYFWVLCLNL